MKICFICHANICRSFISQEILKYLLQKDNRTDIEVISRGTYALDYLTVPSKIKDFLLENDIIYKSHTPTQYSRQDIASSDFIFVMTKQQYDEITDKYSEYSDKVYILEQFVSNKTRDIEDPISLEGKKFKKSANNLKNLILNLYKNKLNF
jgi:protein-tyrosine phosphatase